MAVSDSVKKTLNWAGDKAAGDNCTLITLAFDEKGNTEVLTNIPNATPAMLSAIAADALGWLMEEGKEHPIEELRPPEETKSRIIFEA